MDYTFIVYKMVLLEERVYHYSKEFLRSKVCDGTHPCVLACAADWSPFDAWSKGFPVSGLRFNHELVVRGLIIDKELGNLLKVARTRFDTMVMIALFTLISD